MVLGVMIEICSLHWLVLSRNRSSINWLHLFNSDGVIDMHVLCGQVGTQ